METNHSNLQNAIRRFPVYEPDEEVWNGISHQLGCVPLRQALSEMPSYEPDDKLWELIERKTVRAQQRRWWYSAAAILLAACIGWQLMPQKSGRIAYSQETMDERLQIEDGLKTDQQYRLLKTYCETETLVCNSNEYRSLQEEYERLKSASEQLQHAIGPFNTEPALLRQYNDIERQKADILNAMAKMI